MLTGQDWLALLPPEMSLPVAVVLVASAALTAALTAGLGIGGGVLLLGIMALLVPASALIATHGVVQIGSNVGRTALMWRHVERRLLLPFVLGAVIGAASGGAIAWQLPEALLNGALGLFILYAVWGRWPAMRATGLWLGGSLISFLSMFVGATGPLVAALMKTHQLDRLRHMATFSACMSLQHGLKILAFGLFGFQFGPWWPLLIAMIASGFAGTWLGERWLRGRAEDGFQRGLNLLLTLMALQLLWQSMADLSAR